MPSEHEPLGGADLTCPRCKYMTVRWLSDLQIYSCFRLGCGWEGVDPTNPAPLATQMRQQHEREMAALRAEIHELADALLRVTGGMQEIAAVLQVPNDVPVIDCVIKALAERDELQATVAVLVGVLTEYAKKPDYLDVFVPIRNTLANLPAAVVAEQERRERERRALELAHKTIVDEIGLCERGTCRECDYLWQVVDNVRNALGGGDE
jgi:hypothetical protein